MNPLHNIELIAPITPNYAVNVKLYGHLMDVVMLFQDYCANMVDKINARLMNFAQNAVVKVIPFRL